MHELSGTITMAGPVVIVRHEIELAFARALPMRIEVQPFSLLGKGAGHALGMQGIQFIVQDPNAVLTDEQRKQLEKKANASFEESLLTGMLPGSSTPASRGRPDFSLNNEKFVEEMYDFRQRLDGGDDDLRQWAVYANVMVSILDQLNEARERHDIPADVFDKIGMHAVTAFLDDMPSVRVNIHLRRHWIANSALKAKKNDHNDWFYLGAAVAHCDVVVTERHFAHVVNTGNLRKRATVITDVRDLPRV